MGHLDHLGFAGEQQLMVTDDVTPAHGMKADLTFDTRRVCAFTAMACNSGKALPATFGHGFAQTQGGAGRRVQLAAVMGFDDLAVPVGHRSGRTPRQRGQQGHS